MNAYTGIYQTTCELRARRVLTHLFPLKGEPVRKFAFLIKDGWYEIIVPDVLLGDDEAARLNLLAKTVACTDLPARPLQVFPEATIWHDHTDDEHTKDCGQCQREVLLESGD